MFFISLLVTVGVLVALAIGVDIAARIVAEHQVASRAKSSTNAQGSSASISSFPFLYDVVVDGTVRNVAVHLTEVPLGLLTVGHLDVSVHGVDIDKGQLFAHRKVRVTAISSASASITISAADITSVTHVAVTISGNTVTGSVAGLQIPVSVTVTSGHFLTFSFAGRPSFSFDLARSPLVPPCAMQLTTQQSNLRLTCTVAPVPTSLIAALSSHS
jgi:LmeA-like phospholipid-binding